MFVFYTLSLLFLPLYCAPCNLRETKYGSICVCNSSYCDTSKIVLNLSKNQFQHIYSSKSNLGYHSQTYNIIKKDINSEFAIKLFLNSTYQKILGFGSTFTDAAGQNVFSLPREVIDKFVEANFAFTGNDYSLCRVPIGSTGFSSRDYSYDDVENDIHLQNFRLQREDLLYKIPLITQAKSMKERNNLKLIASPFSAPDWMTKSILRARWLKKEYYQVWAEYLLMFLEDYSKRKIDFWGVTTQNEPSTSYIPMKIKAVGMTPWDRAKWISHHFGPTLRDSNITNRIKILIGDDQKILLPVFALIPKRDKDAMRYLDGVAIHGFFDKYTPAAILKLAYTSKENWLILSTENANGYLASLGVEKAVELGSWGRAENYISNILNDLEYGANGWIDFNMAMDIHGSAPNVKMSLDSPIIVNTTAGEFYKQPMYYALGHFSKLVVPGSHRLKTKVTITKNGVRAMGFLRPDHKVAVIIWNKSNSDVSTDIWSGNKVINVNIKAKSINSVLFVNEL